MKSLLKVIMIYCGIALLMSCSAYQKRFGGKSGDYADSNTTEEIKYPNGIHGLKASDRYSIPDVVANKECVNTEPPDYQN